MKTFNKSRGTGKTTKMLHISEFNDIPILCATMREKEFLLEQTKKLEMNIPEPITIREFSGFVNCGYSRNQSDRKNLINKQEFENFIKDGSYPRNQSDEKTLIENGSYSKCQYDKKILIDEFDHVIYEFFKEMYGVEICGATITCEDKKQKDKN